MSWIKIKVNKYTRTLHPDDHKPGLPKPDPLTVRDEWDEYHVRQNRCGEWVGRNGEVNNWLAINPPYHAEDAKAEQPDPPKKKRTRRTKRQEQAE